MGILHCDAQKGLICSISMIQVIGELNKICASVKKELFSMYIIFSDLMLWLPFFKLGRYMSLQSD